MKDRASKEKVGRIIGCLKHNLREQAEDEENRTKGKRQKRKLPKLSLERTCVTVP